MPASFWLRCNTAKVLLFIALFSFADALAAWGPDGNAVMGNGWIVGQPVSDGAGGMYLTVYDSGTVRLYRLAADGNPDPAFPAGGVVLNTAASSRGVNWNLVSDGADGVWIVFGANNTGATEVYSQYVDRDGLLYFGPQGQQLTTTGQADSGVIVRAVSDGNHGFYCVWTANNRRELRAQRFDRAGDAQGTDPSGQLVATMIEVKDFAIALGSYLYVGYINHWLASADLIYVQRLDATASLPNLTPVNGYPVCTYGSFNRRMLDLTTESLGGDVVLAWEDLRPGIDGNSYQPYVQRVTGAGTAQWTTDGVAQMGVGLGTGLQVCGDGSGGVYLARSSKSLDFTDNDVYVQRLDSNGAAAPGWPAVGWNLTATRPDGQNGYSLPNLGYLGADGSGGALVAWEDLDQQIRVQHVTGGAALATGWPVNGAAATASAGYGRSTCCAIPDGVGGLLLAWYESVGSWTPHYQRMLPVALSGAYLPASLAATDLPDDEGGAIRLEVGAAPAETNGGLLPVTGYDVWRLSTARTATKSLPAGTWESLGFHAATGQASYRFVVPTRYDATALDPAIETYMLTTHTTDPRYFAPSGTVDGASVDNRAPLMPQGLNEGPVAGGLHLQWNANTEPDLAGYEIHRGSTDGFVPSPATLVATIGTNGYTDGGYAPGDRYKVAAFDRHGNVSAFAALAPVSGVGDDPTRVAFAAPRPNPFTGRTTVALALPRAMTVSVRVYDVAGRLVRTIVDGELPAGERNLAWDGSDDRGAPLARGIYLVRVVTPDGVQTRKVMLVR